MPNHVIHETTIEHSDDEKIIKENTKNEKMRYRKIKATKKDFEYLKKKAENNVINVFITNGILRSSKQIKYSTKNKKFYLLHLIDESNEYLSEKEMFDYIKSKNFLWEDIL